MLGTVATKLECRSPAFWEGAVTLPTVRTAGLEPADHYVGAARNPALSSTTTMFAAETLGFGLGGAS